MQLALVFSGSFVVFLAPSRGAEESLRHETSFSQGLQRAQSESKMMFVEFWRDNCIWCKRFDQTLKSPLVIEHLKDTVVVKAKNTENPQEVKRYGVSGYPALMLFDSGGNLIDSNSGYLSADAFIPWFASTKEYYRRISFHLEKLIRQDPKGMSREAAEAHLEMGLILRRNRKYSLAAQSISRARTNELARIERLERKEESDAPENDNPGIPLDKETLKLEYEILDRILYELAKTQILLGKRPEAAKVLQEYDAKLSKPDTRRHSWVLLQLGISLKKTGDVEAARKAFRRCDQLYPSSMEARECRKELALLR